MARFNHSHTLMDVRRFIRASRPDMTVRAGPPCPAAWPRWGHSCHLPAPLPAWSAAWLRCRQQAPLLCSAGPGRPLQTPAAPIPLNPAACAADPRQLSPPLTPRACPCLLPPRPLPPQASYRLAEGIPPKVVEDEAKTLEAAGLLNSVLVQKAA